LLFAQIVDLVEVTWLSSNDLLRSLNLRGNALRELPDCRLSVIFAVQQLTELDTEGVTIAEKVVSYRSRVYWSFMINSTLPALDLVRPCSGLVITFASCVDYTRTENYISFSAINENSNKNEIAFMAGNERKEKWMWVFGRIM